jgi:hypothetical protein
LREWMAPPLSALFVAAALIKDESAMATLFAPIPHREELAAQIRSGVTGFSFQYAEDKRTAFYVVSDGEMVSSYTLTGVTLEQAATVRYECDSITRWGASQFMAAIERAGLACNRVH